MINLAPPMTNPTGRVAGKVALITGGASGIGRAAAKRLAEEGANVIIADIQDDLGHKLAAELGGKGSFFHLDVTSEDNWVAAIAYAAASHGRLDVLVNNAGIGDFAYITDVTLESWRRTMAINLDGVFLGCKYAIPLMRQGGGGSIINISSIAGKVGMDRAGAYCASKGGVLMLTKAVALDSARAGWNIRVNSVHPAFVVTPLVEEFFNKRPNPDRARNFATQIQPIGRMGEPREIANGILFLASDESSFMTGAELVLDGGATAT